MGDRWHPENSLDSLPLLSTASTLLGDGWSFEYGIWHGPRRTRLSLFYFLSSRRYIPTLPFLT